MGSNGKFPSYRMIYCVDDVYHTPLAIVVHTYKDSDRHNILSIHTRIYVQIYVNKHIPTTSPVLWALSIEYSCLKQYMLGKLTVNANDQTI